MNFSGGVLLCCGSYHSKLTHLLGDGQAQNLRKESMRLISGRESGPLRRYSEAPYRDPVHWDRPQPRVGRIRWWAISLVDQPLQVVIDGSCLGGLAMGNDVVPHSLSNCYAVAPWLISASSSGSRLVRCCRW